MSLHQVLGEVGEQLAGRAVVRMIRAVEEATCMASFVAVSSNVRCGLRVIVLVDDRPVPKHQHVHPVRRKQSSASSGRCTIGSFSLNDVLSSTGTPVRCSNALMSCQ